MKRIAVACLLVREFALDETGQDLIEYALVAALVGLGAVASMRTLGTKIVAVYTDVTSSLSSAV